MNLQTKLPTTADDFLRWNEGREGKREFVRGRVVEMMINVTRNHARLAAKLVILIGRRLDLSMFVGLGVLGAAGHYFVARGLTYAPANLVSPFQYFQLFASVVVGYVFFAALPDAATWLGAAIIMGSGLYIGWTQTRVAK